jgi:phosphate:Na+ symporter
MLALFDEWKFLAGLGIFLFGMFMMEESVKQLAGRSFKALIRRFTGTRLKGLATGIVTTSILQSSSAVSLMVLAFVGAGLMSLANAVAVLMGSMIGTTCTAWIVALIGFQFKIDVFALPLIGIGGLGLIFFSSSARFVNVSKLLASFGFLFHGLDFMKSSVEAFAAAFDLAAMPDLGLWVYVVTGIVLTAVMQSSSATIAIILTTLFSGIIDFNQGAAMVIGANVGTTVTILLGAVGGIPTKKQTAASSLIFNAGTALIILPLLPLMLWIIHDFFGLTDNAVLGIALFHTLFNVLGVVLFFPWISLLVRILERLFPEKLTILTRYIHKTTPQIPEAALAALRNEILYQLLLSMRYIAARYGLRQGPSSGQPWHEPTQDRPPTTYGDLERLHAAIFTFYAQMQTEAIDPQEAVQLEPIIRSSRSIMNATRNLYERLPEVEEIGKEDNSFLIEAHETFLGRLQQVATTIEQVAAEARNEVQEEELRLLFQAIEEADKRFLRACSSSVARRIIREQDVTRLLMINRFLTQSSRMLVLSMQALLTKNGSTAAPAMQASPEPHVG